MAASELLLTNGATPATPAAGKTKLFVNSSKQIAQVDDAGAVKALVGGNASYAATPGDPTGTTNTTGLMMGLAGAITPATTGRIRFAITGNLSNSGTSIGNGCKAQLYFGTGSAPANAAAITGTVSGAQLTSVNESTTASTKQPVSLEYIVSGLTLGTAYWFDAAIAAITAGTASLSNVTMTAMEF